MPRAKREWRRRPCPTAVLRTVSFCVGLVATAACGLGVGCDHSATDPLCAAICEPSATFSADCRQQASSKTSDVFLAEVMSVQTSSRPGVFAVTLSRRESGLETSQATCTVRVDELTREVLLNPRYTAAAASGAELSNRYVACLVRGLTPASDQEAAVWHIHYDPETTAEIEPPIPDLPDATVLVAP